VFVIQQSQDLYCNVCLLFVLFQSHCNSYWVTAERYGQSHAGCPILGQQGEVFKPCTFWQT